MIAYVDSSVLLRIVLGQKQRLKQWASIDRALASALIEVECLRTLDRLRHRAGLSDEALVIRREAVYHLTREMDIVELSPAVLSRASQPLPTPLRTLDAIHLATALLWHERFSELVMATHDKTLGLAARACGLSVVGV
jgi:uncharacterized protein